MKYYILQSNPPFCHSRIKMSKKITMNNVDFIFPVSNLLKEDNFIFFQIVKLILIDLIEFALSRRNSTRIF